MIGQVLALNSGDVAHQEIPLFRVELNEPRMEPILAGTCHKRFDTQDLGKRLEDFLL